MTRLPRYYGWLRLPRITAHVLALTLVHVLALTLVHGCPPPADRCADLPGFPVLSMSGSTRPRTPGSISAARHCAAPVVACRGAKPVGTLQPKFSGLNTFKGGSTRYLCTSPAYLAYAPTRLLPDAPQGSILGSWLTITQAGFTPARTRGLARPHCPFFRPARGKTLGQSHQVSLIFGLTDVRSIIDQCPA